MSTPDQIREWLDAPEGRGLEIKQARNRFDFEELVRYCVAIGNEGGGRFWRRA